MSDPVELVKYEHAETVRLRSKCFLVVNLNGASYLSKKAVSILNLKDADTVSFFHSADMRIWYIYNDPHSGVSINKVSGTYRICDKELFRKIFKGLEVKGNKAHFALGDRLQEIGGKMCLYVIPNPFNVE